MAMAFVPATLSAQNRAISIDIRGGYSVPFGDFGDVWGNDWGFGAGGVLSLTPSIGVYAGWARDAFDCEIVGCGDDSRLHVSGLEAGAKFIIPTDIAVLPWAKAGVVYHKAELDESVVGFETDRNLGFQGAVGFDFPLGDVLSVSPSVRVTLLDFGDDEEFFEQAEARYVNFDVAAHIHIPGF
jgi:hypothetical protein